MMNSLKVFLVLVPFLLTACGGSTFSNSGAKGLPKADQAQAKPMSANDMAFLFPLDDSGRPVPFVTLDSEPDIPGSGNFNRIMQQADADNVFINNVISDPNNWAMVSFRYSPCIFFVGLEAPCKEQVRFVYQPMDQSGLGAFLDFSLHVTYEFNAADTPQTSEVMSAFLNLRDTANGRTDNLPLAVHPVLSDGLESANYANQIRNIVWEPFIFNRDPKAITFMGLGEAQGGGVNLGEWRFTFGLIDENGAWNQQSLPDGSGQTVEVLGVNPTNGLLESNITADTGFNVLTGGPVNENAAARALVPHVSNEHNVSCASCHVVDNQVIRSTPGRLDLTNFSFDQFATTILNSIDDASGFGNYLTSNELKGGMFTQADGIPVVIGADTPNDASDDLLPEDEVVTRMFGYMHSEPVISQRMAFDNGMAVNEINKILGVDTTDEVVVQSNRCSTFSQQINTLSCLFEGGFSTSLEQCIQQSCDDGF